MESPHNAMELFEYTLTCGLLYSTSTIVADVQAGQRYTM